MAIEKESFDSSQSGEHDFLLGEEPPEYVAVQMNIPTKRFITTEEEFIAEINEGEVGKRARKFKKMGRAVALARGSGGYIKEYVAKNREHITDFAIAGAGLGAGVATVILLSELREHGLPAIRKKSGKESSNELAEHQ